MKKDFTQEEYLNRVLTAPVSDTCCPMHRTLELLSGKWRTHIIYELCKKPSYRFDELKKAVPPITNTMLTNTLRDLEKYRIVHREQFNEIPPHVEYSLTEKGRALLPVFTELAHWGETYLAGAETDSHEKTTLDKSRKYATMSQDKGEDRDE